LKPSLKGKWLPFFFLMLLWAASQREGSGGGGGELGEEEGVAGEGRLLGGVTASEVVDCRGGRGRQQNLIFWVVGASMDVDLREGG
jgi:hypothetical protein